MINLNTTTTKAVLIAAVSLALVACASAPKPQAPVYGESHLMNRIEVGMSADQAQAILGNPRSSSGNSHGFRCAEFALTKFGPSSSANTFFVMFRRGAVVETGENTCHNEMNDSNFRHNKVVPGKYSTLLGQ